MGVASYGMTLVLVGAGAADRAEHRPWLPLLAAAKVGADAVGGGYLFAEQVTRHRAVCSWCVVAAAASWASLPLVLPEARRAWRVLRGRTHRPALRIALVVGTLLTVVNQGGVLLGACRVP